MEIKFRGKRVDNGEWVCGDFHQLCKNPHIHTIDGGTYNVILDTVGQYIGHKDEVNTEIYYGDIIDNDDYIFLVRNALYGCYLEQLSSLEDEEDEDWSAYLSTHPITDNSKIIGNIHDNPELLTK